MSKSRRKTSSKAAATREKTPPNVIVFDISTPSKFRREGRSSNVNSSLSAITLDDNTVFPELEDLVGGELESDLAVSARISLPIISESDDEGAAVPAAAAAEATTATTATAATAAITNKIATPTTAARTAARLTTEPAAGVSAAGAAVNSQGTMWSRDEKLYLIESWKMHWFEYNEKDITNNRKGEINNAIFDRHCLRYVFTKGVS
jgi:hypothetical protein